MEEKDFIEFAKIIGKLKRTPRTGWKIRRVKKPESVADHTFRATILGMVLSDIEKFNTEKVIRMLILHDVGEAITGDIPLIRKCKDMKRYKKIEEKAVKKILSKLPQNLKEKYLNLWKEMENCKSKEAKFCKDIDNLEKMIQVLEYEKIDKEKRLSVFWKRDMNKPQRYPLLKKIFKELERERGIK